MPGHLAAWNGLAVVAAQWALGAAPLLVGDAMAVTPVVAAVLLVAAGVFESTQCTPPESACPVQCQNPLDVPTPARQE